MVTRKKSAAHEHGQVQKHQEEFATMARRNRLLGLWAAAKMGIEGDAAAAYAKEVVASDLEEPGDADVVRKVMGDFASRGVRLDEDELHQEMDVLLAVARDQMEAEKL